MLIIGRTSLGRRKHNRGFTLMELMIVVAIVAILAAIAYPSYMDSVRKSNRADGKSSLSEAAQRMQRCYTANYTYVDCVDDHTSSEEHYNITVPTETANTFVLRATATGSPQSGDTAACRVYEIDHRGERGPQAAIDADCW